MLILFPVCPLHIHSRGNRSNVRVDIAFPSKTLFVRGNLFLASSRSNNVTDVFQPQTSFQNAFALSMLSQFKKMISFCVLRPTVNGRDISPPSFVRRLLRLPQLLLRVGTLLGRPQVSFLTLEDRSVWPLLQGPARAE